jgi:ABC-type bacteriocin/lantibiotic exporter with double-glycine peptidase domain
MMKLLLRRYRQVRLKIENSRIWGLSTQSTLRFVISSLVVFTAAMLMMLASVFLFTWCKVFGLLAFVAFVALLLVVNILADEGRRREKGR